MMKGRFFKLSIFFISVFILSTLFLSFSSFLIRPYYQTSRKKKFIEVPGFKELIAEHPTKLTFELVKQDAFMKTNEVQDVWVVKHSPKRVTVFSPICPHLGCRYFWDTDGKKFVCPCHLSIFSLNGKVLSGPSPRPLDTLPYEIKDGKLFIQWELFKPGLPKKVEISSCNTIKDCKWRKNLIVGMAND